MLKPKSTSRNSDSRQSGSSTNQLVVVVGLAFWFQGSSSRVNMVGLSRVSAFLFPVSGFGYKVSAQSFVCQDFGASCRGGGVGSFLRFRV